MANSMQVKRFWQAFLGRLSGTKSIFLDSADIVLLFGINTGFALRKSCAQLNLGYCDNIF